MKVLGSGASPLNVAPLKSNPAFSSWNLSNMSSFFIVSLVKGSTIPEEPLFDELSPSLPVSAPSHVSPRWTFARMTWMTDVSGSRYQEESEVLTFEKVFSSMKKRSLLFKPILSRFDCILTLKSRARLFAGVSM